MYRIETQGGQIVGHTRSLQQARTIKREFYQARKVWLQIVKG